MMKKQLYVFEGYSGAGKSTSIMELVKNNSIIDGINIKMSQVLGQVATSNYVDYTNSAYYLLLEELKTALFNDSHKKYVVMERYFLSSLAHGYAMSKLLNNDDYYDKIYSWYKHNLDHTIREPDAYVYFDLPLDVAMNRIYQRNETVVNSVWIQEDYLKLCEEYKHCYFKEQGCKVYYIDAEQTKEQVIEELQKLFV